MRHLVLPERNNSRSSHHLGLTIWVDEINSVTPRRLPRVYLLARTQPRVDCFRTSTNHAVLAPDILDNQALVHKD